MRGLALPIQHHEAGPLRLDILPMHCVALGGREWMLRIPVERVVRRRQAPLGQNARWHWRQVPFPRYISRSPYFKVREIGGARQDRQGYLAFLKATLQIVH